MVHPYLNRRNGREPVDYIDDRFNATLERTLGVPIFQEQILQMAMIIADFTGSEAEELRRAISFHRSDERMAKVLQKLTAAMRRKGVPPQTQDRVVKSIRSFALYGFPESHAISFALLAYASAWLKAHRAPEFYAALLNNQPMGFYSPATLVKDARRHGIRVRPVCVAQSEVPTAVESDEAIRLGFRQVKGLSRAAAERIAAERGRRPWRDLADFAIRARLSKAERRTLARIGALNALADHRRDALWRVEEDIDPESLFAWASQSQSQSQTLNSKPSTPPQLAKMTPPERLESDYAGLDLTTGPHPVAYLRDQLAAEGILRAIDVPDARPGSRVTIAGMVICRQRPGSAKGHVFVSLEDETGIANAFIHGDRFPAMRLIVNQEPFLKLTGTLQKTPEAVTSIYVHEAAALHFGAAVAGQSHDYY
ncbi:MAG: hypothetical protein R3F11_26565 [Verrucomicrobiales bacterium]